MLLPYRDDNPRVLIPYVTYVLLITNVILFFIAPRELVGHFGITPNKATIDFGYFALTLLTLILLENFH